MFYSVHIRTYSVLSALKFKCLGPGLGLANWCHHWHLGLVRMAAGIPSH